MRGRPGPATALWHSRMIPCLSSPATSTPTALGLTPVWRCSSQRLRRPPRHSKRRISRSRVSSSTPPLPLLPLPLPFLARFTAFTALIRNSTESATPVLYVPEFTIVYDSYSLWFTEPRCTLLCRARRFCRGEPRCSPAFW